MVFTLLQLTPIYNYIIFIFLYLKHSKGWRIDRYGKTLNLHNGDNARKELFRLGIRKKTVAERRGQTTEAGALALA
jgi:hypothetical protein